MNIPQEDIDSFLLREYSENWKSTIYLARIVGVHRSTISRKLIKLGVKLRDTREYLDERIRKPSNSALRYYYHMHKPVSDVARERGVCAKTVYRWMDKAGIERRKGSDCYLNNGTSRPSDEKLARLLMENSQGFIAKIYGVNPHTIRKWKWQAGLHKFRKSKYDDIKTRKDALLCFLDYSGKNLNELRLDDFRQVRQRNRKSYRGLLNWYISHYNCRFGKAKEYMEADLYGKNRLIVPNSSKLSLESSL